MGVWRGKHLSLKVGVVGVGKGFFFLLASGGGAQTGLWASAGSLWNVIEAYSFFFEAWTRS